MFDAGIVTFVPRGDWVNNVTYYPLNIVNYDGLSWIARRENVGQTPADGQYWQPNGTAVPIATTSVAGKVMPDGTSITVDQQGHISAVFSADLDDLDNVNITSPSNNQVLKYNATSQEWENGTDTGGLIPHLIIISETGSTVTVTKGAWSTTATETSTGHFECDVPEFGTYTIDAVLAGDDAQVSLVVDAVKIYTVDDSHFHADITVTYPTGATVSCSKTGETTMYATGSPYTFTVHSSGTWTITCAADGNTYTANVVISTSGQTESLTLPTGSTVTPTDDVKTLVHCAGLSASGIDDLSDLFADSTTLLAVTSSNNAVDYLVRSKSWINKNLVPVMTSDTTPSGVASAIKNELVSGGVTYYAYLAFDGKLNTRYASGEVNDGVVYQFTSPKCVKRAYARLEFSGSHTVLIKGSNDGSTWTTLWSGTWDTDGTYFDLSSNNDSYLYYSFETTDNWQTTISTLEYYAFAQGFCDNSIAMTDIGANNYCANTLLADSDWLEAIMSSQYVESVLNVKVPTMTSATTPSGVASADSYYTEGYEAWRAFSKSLSPSSCWHSTAVTADHWIQYQFTSPVRVNYVYILDRIGGTTGSVAPVLKGSNDGTNWTDIATLNYTATSTGESHRFSVSNNNNYSYYRLYYPTSPQNYIQIQQLQFYGREDV